jgi:myo-inositol-1(or 4)-monophosphatase
VLPRQRTSARIRRSHINSYDCLGGIAIVNAAGGQTNDFLTGAAMTRGNRIIAGPPQLYDQLGFSLDAAAPPEPPAVS